MSHVVRVTCQRAFGRTYRIQNECAVRSVFHRSSATAIRAAVGQTEPRCVWLIGSASRAKKLIHRPAASGHPVFDFSSFEYRSFDVCLEALEEYFAGLLVARLRPICVKGVLPKLFERITLHCPELAVELCNLVTNGLQGKASQDEVAQDVCEPAAYQAWMDLAREGTESCRTDTAAGLVKVLRAVAIAGEQDASPIGWHGKPTGEKRILYLVRALEASAFANECLVTLSLLNVEILSRSLFMDGRGEALLGWLLEQFPKDRTPHELWLRLIICTADSHTAIWGTSRPFAYGTVSVECEKLLASTQYRASGTAGVITLHELVAAEDPANGDAIHVCDTSSQATEKNKFEWKLDQVLGHPKILGLRRRHETSKTSFAIVLWETIRSICNRPYLAIPTQASDLRNPVVLAMIDINLLEPRWGPSRAVLCDEATRRHLLAWVEGQHEKLTWPQRLEYNLQLLRDRPEVLRKLELRNGFLG